MPVIIICQSKGCTAIAIDVSPEGKHICRDCNAGIRRFAKNVSTMHRPERFKRKSRRHA